jgi:hypothetical protein
MLGVLTAATALVVAASGLAPTSAAGQTSTDDPVSGDAVQPSPYAGRVGMGNHMFWYNADTVTATYQSMAAGGVRHSREDFIWGVIEPQNNQWDWSRPDDLMTGAARAGVEVLGILDYSAPWASSSGTNTQAYPRSNADFTDYATKVAQRYGPGGTFWASHPELTPKPIRTLEVWNEPSGYWNAAPNPDPVRYASLALATAQAVHAVSGDIDVIIDGSLMQARTDGQIRSWIGAILDAQPTLKNHIDGYSVHPYPYPPPQGPYATHDDPRWDYGVVEEVRALTVSKGAAKPIYITEVGWSTAPDGEGVVNEATQAQYVVGAIRRAVNEWGSYVPRVYIYSFDRDGSDTTEREAFFGLRRRDGSYKPAWPAVQELLADQVTTTPPPTTPLPPERTMETRAVGPSRIVVRLLGSTFYYDLA